MDAEDLREAERQDRKIYNILKDPSKLEDEKIEAIALEFDKFLYDNDMGHVFNFANEAYLSGVFCSWAMLVSLPIVKVDAVFNIVKKGLDQ